MIPKLREQPAGKTMKVLPHSLCFFIDGSCLYFIMCKLAGLKDCNFKLSGYFKNMQKNVKCEYHTRQSLQSAAADEILKSVFPLCTLAAASTTKASKLARTLAFIIEINLTTLYLDTIHSVHI